MHALIDCEFRRSSESRTFCKQITKCSGAFAELTDNLGQGDYVNVIYFHLQKTLDTVFNLHSIPKLMVRCPQWSSTRFPSQSTSLHSLYKSYIFMFTISASDFCLRSKNMEVNDVAREQVFFEWNPYSTKMLIKHMATPVQSIKI
jgi:hypothetical protein